MSYCEKIVGDKIKLIPNTVSQHPKIDTIKANWFKKFLQTFFCWPV